MQDLNDKITGGTLSAAEWNELPSETQNVIEDTGQTLSSGDLNQLGKGIANYVSNGTFYTDSGAADAYVLTTIGSKQSSTTYTDGLRVSFIADNDNTGAATVNVATLGVKNIKLSDGTNPGAGQISGRTELVFDLGNDRFELVTAVSIVTQGSNANGSFRQTSDGSVIQHGLKGGAGTGFTVTLPIAFTDAVYDVVVTHAGSDATVNAVFLVIDATSFTVKHTFVGTASISWVATRVQG